MCHRHVSYFSLLCGLDGLGIPDQLSQSCQEPFSPRGLDPSPHGVGKKSTDLCFSSRGGEIVPVIAFKMYRPFVFPIFFGNCITLDFSIIFSQSLFDPAILDIFLPSLSTVLFSSIVVEATLKTRYQDKYCFLLPVPFSKPTLMGS